MRTTSGTRKRQRQDIQEIANESFANHTLKVEQDQGPVRMWLCSRPGTGMYHFRVVAAPGWLAVYGDVGNHMLSANDKDLIPWLKRSVKSYDYLISKFENVLDLKDTFFPEEAEKLLEECDAEGMMAETYPYDSQGQKFVDKVREDWDKEYGDHHDFCSAFYNAGGDPELLDRVVDFGPSVWWTVECLKKFVELLEAHDESTKTENEGALCSSYTALDHQPIPAPNLQLVQSKDSST